MKNLLKKSLITIASMGTFFSFNAMAMDNQSFEKLKVIKDIQGKVTGSKLIAKNVDLYLVQGIDAQQRSFKVIIDKNGDYLILSSKVFDVKKNKPITIPKDISILKNQEAFTYGNGKKHFYVFTDPECPFCKKFEATWESMKNDVTLHVYFYNLSSHKNANAMTRWVLDGKNNEEKATRLLKISKGDSSYKDIKLSKAKITQYNNLISKHRELGNKLGVQGIPTVLDSNGKLIPWPQIKKEL